MTYWRMCFTDEWIPYPKAETPPAGRNFHQGNAPADVRFC
jgi:hypothetical protein